MSDKIIDLGVAAEWTVRIEPAIFPRGGFRVSYRPNGEPGFAHVCATWKEACDLIARIASDISRAFVEARREAPIKGRGVLN